MLRLLVLTEPYYPKYIGGGGRFAHNLCTALSGRGLDITVLCSDERRSSIESVDGLRVHRLYIPGDSWEPKGIETRARHLIDYAEKNLSIPDFDLVHDLGGWYFHRLGPHLRERHGKPLIVHCQVVIYNFMKSLGWPEALCRIMNAYQKQLMAVADHLVFQTNYEYRTAQNLGLVRDNVPVSIIPNGIELNVPNDDRSKLDGIRRQLSIPDGRIVLFAGRTGDPIKGADIVFQAFSRVARLILDVFLVVASPDRSYFDLLGAMEKRAIHVGWVNPKHMACLHRLADITVMPSRYEALGTVALEAMGAGKPVIVSAVGGLDEVVEDGVTGLKLRGQDWVSELAEKLMLLLNNPDLARQIGEQAARAARKRFAIELVTDQILQVYERITRSGS